MIIEQNKFGITSIDTEKQILHEHFGGRFNINLLNVHFKAIENFLKLKKARGSMVDIRKVYGSFAKILEYVEFSYFPALEQGGVHYQAFIVPDDLIFQNLIEKVKNISLQFNIEIQIFDDREQASSWLQEKLKV